MIKCFLCPRECGTARELHRGYCGEMDTAVISRAALHMWEEPPISGTRGSGTIFFCGCNLKCVFCQNKTISRGGGTRKEVSSDELADIMLSLEAQGAHNINLVTPTHFAHKVIDALYKVRHKLTIPVVYNSSGYEKAETLKSFEGLVDIYLPDFKYASGELAALYSCAPDYPEVARAAIKEMFRQTGDYKIDEDQIMQKGVIVRHLVLPSCRRDSISVLDIIADTLPVNDIKLSLMSQYTPEFALDCEFKNLHRKLTSFEYNSVLGHAIELGFDGYFQHISSASSSYTPDFEK